MPEQLTNWAGNYTYHASRLHEPKTVEQIQELVAGSGLVRTLGSRHSFNDIADTTGDHISLRHLDKVIELDRERGRITIEGGMTYGQLGVLLHEEGFALHNMASLPHISVAGACATATHGSGVGNGNLATAVHAVELVTGSGERVMLSREKDGERFAGVVVHLGGLGVVTKLTLAIEPTYDVQQDVYQFLPLSELEQHFDEIVGGAYSVSLFTNWRSEHVNQVWLKRRVAHGKTYPTEPEFFGATRLARRMHPIPELSAESCTEQVGIPGPWHERLPHFRMEFTPSAGDELQTEYFVPHQHGLAAFHALHQIRQQIVPLLMVSEIRTIAVDDLWMSPSYKQACVGFHFTWHKNWPAVSQLLPLVEAQLAPFEVRPHWGKLFTLPPAQVQQAFTRLPDFQALLREYDPQGKFQNKFLETYVVS